MAGRLRTKKIQLKNMVRREMAEIIHDTAERILRGSNRTIATHPYEEGVGLGPGAREMDVVNSGYFLTSSDAGTVAYDAAVRNMLDTPMTRTGKRDQTAPVAMPEKMVNTETATIAYAAEHAELLHDGYEIQGRYMQGTHFLYDSMLQEWPYLLDQTGKMLQRLESLKAYTLYEVHEMELDAEVRSGRRYAGASDREMRQEFRAHYQSPEELERQFLNVKGFDAKGREVRYRQTARERDDNVEQLYQEWLALRSGGYDA